MGMNSVAPTLVTDPWVEVAVRRSAYRDVDGDPDRVVSLTCVDEQTTREHEAPILARHIPGVGDVVHIRGWGAAHEVRGVAPTRHRRVRGVTISVRLIPPARRAELGVGGWMRIVSEQTRPVAPRELLQPGSWPHLVFYADDPDYPGGVLLRCHYIGLYRPHEVPGAEAVIELEGRDRSRLITYWQWRENIVCGKGVIVLHGRPWVISTTRSRRGRPRKSKRGDGWSA